MIAGIDIGGTSTKLGLVDQGRVVDRARIPTTGHADAGAFAEALVVAVRELVARSGGTLGGIGIGAPNGNQHTGTIVMAPNLPWKQDVPLAAMLGERLGVPCTLGNDAEDILRMLRTYYVDQLLELGEPLEDSRALSMLLWGDEDHMTPAEELVAWTAHERSSARPVEERPERPDVAARAPAPAEERPAGDEATAPADEPAEVAEEAPAEADGPSRRRRRRRKRRGEGGAGAPAGGEETSEGEDEEPPAEEPPAEEPPAEEPPAEEPPAEEPAPKARRGRRGYTRRTLTDDDAAPAPASAPASAPESAPESAEQAPKRPRRRKATPTPEE